ncbi:MAG TPA: SDR family oxidoreductase [Acidimicrobiia bacterium]|jgi:NAD(P)-dependent dehydrogenase (short-subunit alcohol dehydrogenase family)
MIELDGAVCLITGAGGAIGSATAERIVACGGRVVLHDSNEPAVRRTADRLGSAARVFVGDLGNMKHIESLWSECLGAHGQIDVLINNAGVYPAAPLSADLEDWVRAWDFSLRVNLLAPAVLCRAAILYFSDRETGGIIINMASRAAFRGEDPDYWSYAAAKAGIVAMTKTLARQYGRQGVTAFAIAPGYVDTDFNAPFRDQFGVEAAARDTGLGEVAQPSDIANVVAFLASGLARHATGATIDVNGASYVR